MAAVVPEHRRCVRCGTEAEVIASRALTALDVEALEGATGPTVNGCLLLCNQCGRVWIVLASDTGCWYGMGGSD